MFAISSRDELLVFDSKENDTGLDYNNTRALRVRRSPPRWMRPGSGLGWMVIKNLTKLSCSMTGIVGGIFVTIRSVIFSGNMSQTVKNATSRSVGEYEKNSWIWTQMGIGGFRDTYLGRQVVSKPRGPRAGMGSAGALGSAASSPSGVWGRSPSQNRI